MKKIFVIFLISAVVGCGQKEMDMIFFQKVIGHEKLGSKYKALFIVPGAGCQGCITGAEIFIKKNIDQYEDVLFVFTSIKSMKILRMSIGTNILEKNNVLLDSTNVFFNYAKEKNIYPTIVYLDNGNVNRVEYISPENKYSITQLMDIYD